MDEIITLGLTDDKIDDVVEMIVNGTHYREIASFYGSSLTGLFNFLNRPKHSARVKEAREMAAHILVDEAERVLAQAKDNPALLAVARDLAHHYRWKASMIYGRQYGMRKVIVNEVPEGQEKDELIIEVKYDEAESNGL